MPTLEELETQLSAAQARLKEVNDEAKGHRLNASNAREEAATLKADLDKAKLAAIEADKSVAVKMAEIEKAQHDAIKAAEAKAAEVSASAQQRALKADLRIAAKDAGAQDAGDVLALLDMTKLKTNDAGDVINGAELMAELKKTKPYLFGATSTSNPNPAPKPGSEAKSVKDMTDEEFAAAKRARSYLK